MSHFESKRYKKYIPRHSSRGASNHAVYTIHYAALILGLRHLDRNNFILESALHENSFLRGVIGGIYIAATLLNFGLALPAAVVGPNI